MDSYDTEFELQRQPPRRVECRTGRWGAIGAFWFVLLPHTWVAVAAPFLVVFMWTQVLFTTQTTGTITGQTTYTSKGVDYYKIKFAYSLDNKDYTGETRKSKNLWEHAPGEQLPIYVSRLTPSWNADTDRNGSLGAALFMTLWTTFWSGIMFTMGYACCAPLLQSKWLCKYGLPTKAKVLSVEQSYVRRSGSPIYKATYQYAAVDRSSGRFSEQQYTSKQSLGTGDRNNVSPGDTVTVLYNPNRPSSSIIYKCGAYKAL